MKKVYRELLVVGSVLAVSMSAHAGVISFSQLKADKAGGVIDQNDGAVSVSGYTAVDGTYDVTTPSGGPYVYTQTLTVSGIDFSTGLAGGTDSFSFDLTYSASGSKLDFRASAGVLLDKSDPLTVTIGNFQVLSGTGSVSFDGWDLINTRLHNVSGEFIDIYEGTSTAGDLLLHAPDYNGSAFGNHTFSSTDSSITLTYDGSSAYLNGVSFGLDVVPEPATVGLISAAGVVMLVIRRIGSI